MNLLERLEAHSTWEPNSGCRIWLGTLSREHGEIKVAGKKELVHRVAWELEKGPIPKGMWVLHSCGLGPCFNVNHLRLGTHAENASDRAGHGGYLGKPGGGLKAQLRMTMTAAPKRVRAVDPPLSYDELRRILSYNSANGEFRWKLRSDRNKDWNHRFAGEEAGSVLQIGYRYIMFNGKLHLAHRVAWFYMTGQWPTGHVDHINRVKTDNRWANLRSATCAQNGANVGVRSTNKSGIKGVSWDVKSRKWYAKITINYKQIGLGYFSTVEEATEARRVAETEHHGAFAHSGVN